MVKISSKSEVFQFSGGAEAPYWGGLHVTCDAHFQTRTRYDICEHVCEIL